MELKELGRTGVMVPEIGLGTWKYSGGPAPLLRGIDLGANLIDTAEMYRTEDAVGQAIAGRRDEVFLATKVLGSHLRDDQVMRAADESLRRLAVDYIDLYQIHWSNNSVPIAETMGAMEELVNAGKVRYIGVSNFSVAELREAQAAMTKHPIVSNQVLYNLNARLIEQDTLQYCQENGITIMAYTPLADGSLASSPRFRQDQKSKVLDQVSAETGKTRSQVALN
jgi:diketogulonate reductase-like aldo/keto reductase